MREQTPLSLLQIMALSKALPIFYGHCASGAEINELSPLFHLCRAAQDNREWHQGLGCFVSHYSHPRNSKTWTSQFFSS
jgi:hypothetical protein